MSVVIGVPAGGMGVTSSFKEEVKQLVRMVVHPRQYATSHRAVVQQCGIIFQLLLGCIPPPIVFLVWVVAAPFLLVGAIGSLLFLWVTYG